MSSTAIAPLFQGVSTQGSSFHTSFIINAQTLSNYTYVVWAAISSENTEIGNILCDSYGNFKLQADPSTKTLSLSFGGDTILTATNAYVPDLVTQFALTLNQSSDNNGQVNLYVNGILLGSARLNNISANPYGLLYFLEGLSGTMKYVRLYDSCLSATELYNNTFDIAPEDASNITAEFTYSKNQPTDVVGDCSLGYGDNSKVLVENIGVQLNGVSAIVAPQLPSNFGLANTDFSVQAWVYVDEEPAQWQSIFCNQSATAGFTFFLEFTGSQNLLGIMRSGESSPITIQAVDVVPGQWVNVAISYLAGSVSFWVNGKSILYNYSMPALNQSGNSGIPKIGAAYQNYFFSDLNSYFKGLIQSVAVWNRGITQQETQAYMYNIPSYDDSLMAFYNFVISPQDLVDNMGFTLEGSPTPHVQQTLFTLGSALPAPLYDVTPPDQEPVPTNAKINQKAARGTFSDGTAMFSEAHLDKIVAAYKKSMKATDSNTAAKTADYRSKVAAAFDAAKEDPAFLNELKFHVQHHFEKDDVVFTFHHPDGKAEEVHRAKRDTLDDCTIFWISFGITVICALFAVLGVSLVPKKISDFVTKKLIPICLEALKNIFVGAITGATLVAVLQLLWDNDLISSLVWTCVKSLGWWGLTKLIAKLVALVIPGADAAAIAAYIAGAAVAMVKVVVAYSNKPSSCS